MVPTVHNPLVLAMLDNTLELTGGIDPDAPVPVSLGDEATRDHVRALLGAPSSPRGRDLARLDLAEFLLGAIDIFYNDHEVTAGALREDRERVVLAASAAAVEMIEQGTMSSPEVLKRRLQAEVAAITPYPAPHPPSSPGA